MYFSGSSPHWSVHPAWFKNPSGVNILLWQSQQTTSSLKDWNLFRVPINISPFILLTAMATATLFALLAPWCIAAMTLCCGSSGVGASGKSWSVRGGSSSLGHVTCDVWVERGNSWPRVASLVICSGCWRLGDWLDWPLPAHTTHISH